MAGGALWAKRRSGAKDDAASAPSASAASSGSSVSSASDDGFEDDKFHLPPDHQPFQLLPGWDQLPPPPPEPDTGSSGSSSTGDSGSESSTESESASSDSGDDDEEEDQPQAQPLLPAGFSCQNCAMFKARGNGTYGCESKDYQRWAGTDTLVETKSGRPVLNPDRASSDWYKPAIGPAREPVPTRHTPDAKK
jgi:hypothetical protein